MHTLGEIHVVLIYIVFWYSFIGTTIMLSVHLRRTECTFRFDTKQNENHCKAY